MCAEQSFGSCSTATLSNMACQSDFHYIMSKDGLACQAELSCSAFFRDVIPQNKQKKGFSGFSVSGILAATAGHWL